MLTPCLLKYTHAQSSSTDRHLAFKLSRNSRQLHMEGKGKELSPKRVFISLPRRYNTPFKAALPFRLSLVVCHRVAIHPTLPHLHFFSVLCCILFSFRTFCITRSLRGTSVLPDLSISHLYLCITQYNILFSRLTCRWLRSLIRPFLLSSTNLPPLFSFHLIIFLEGTRLHFLLI